MTDQQDPRGAQPGQAGPDTSQAPPPVPPWQPPIPPQPPQPGYGHVPGPHVSFQPPAYGYAPPPVPTPPKRGLSAGALVALIGGGILALVAVGLVLGFAIFSSLPDTAALKAASAAGVVRDHLTAVADSDAELALSYLGEAPERGPLLTDEALAVSNELAPITDIEVGEVEFDTLGGQVPVTYTRGEDTVSVEYTVIDYDQDGQWQISGGTGTFVFTRFTGLDVTINDQSIDSDFIAALPGTYEFATSLDNFEITGATTVTVTDPYEFPSLSGMAPALSDSGLALFRQAVRAAVDQCIASTALAAGCGIDLPATLDDGTELVDGTVTRTLPVDTQTALDSLEAYVGFDTPTLVEGEYIGGVDVSADCTQNGVSGRCDLVFAPSLEVPYVDMAGDNPTVRWD